MVDGEWATTLRGRVSFQMRTAPFGQLTVSASALKVTFGWRRTATVITVAHEELDRIEVTRSIARDGVVIIPRAARFGYERLRFGGLASDAEAVLRWYGWPVMVRDLPFQTFTPG